MADNKIHGMMIDGRELNLPNTSLDTDGWQKIKGDGTSNSGYSNAGGQYRIKNGILYAIGFVNAWTEDVHACLPIDPRWKLPTDTDEYSVANVWQNGNYPAAWLVLDPAKQDGFLIHSGNKGGVGSAYFNFSIPII